MPDGAVDRAARKDRNRAAGPVNPDTYEELIHMAKVLLFNFTQDVRRKKVKALLFRLAIPGREVQPEEQGQTIAALLGEASDREAPGTEREPFREEMIVMHGLAPRQFHGLLDGMKAQGIRVPLKAVVTETNLSWTACQLRKELQAEAEAIRGGGSSIHEAGGE